MTSESLEIFSLRNHCSFPEKTEGPSLRDPSTDAASAMVSDATGASVVLPWQAHQDASDGPYDGAQLHNQFEIDESCLPKPSPPS